MFLIIQNKPPSEFRPNFSNQQKKSQILTTFQQLQKAASLSPPPVQKRQLHAAKLFTTHRCVLVERGGIRSRGTELCICGVYEKERKNFNHLATPDGNGTCAGDIKNRSRGLKVTSRRRRRDHSRKVFLFLRGFCTGFLLEEEGADF